MPGSLPGALPTSQTHRHNPRMHTKPHMTHTTHTRQHNRDSNDSSAGGGENFRAIFILPISFHSAPLSVAPTAEAMWAAERMWRPGVHPYFPSWLCDPRRSLHLSSGSPARPGQLFPPLALSLSPPPSWGAAPCALSPPAVPVGVSPPWGPGASRLITL